MSDIILKVFIEALQVTIFVAVMMIIVDLIHTLSNGKIRDLVRGPGKFRQYIISSFIGTIPGCFGGFTNVSLYMHRVISFGALAGSMIAVSGDEAFIMLALFPKQALILFSILFIIGVLSGKIIDMIIIKNKISTCNGCNELAIHKDEKNLKHFFKIHIYKHIIKKHIWKTFLWTFFALLVIEIGIKYLNLEKITLDYQFTFLILSAVVGLIPESGPHMFFVSMYASGLIPFSILLTSSIVQDGHGMLPMLSYSISDSIKIKLFNFTIGLIIGSILFVSGY